MRWSGEHLLECQQAKDEESELQGVSSRNIDLLSVLKTRLIHVKSAVDNAHVHFFEEVEVWILILLVVHLVHPCIRLLAQLVLSNAFQNIFDAVELFLCLRRLLGEQKAEFVVKRQLLLLLFFEVLFVEFDHVRHLLSP